MNNLGFVLLAYISILEALRQNLPVLSIVTFGEKFIITFMMSSMFPILDVMTAFHTDSMKVRAQSGADDAKMRLRSSM